MQSKLRHPFIFFLVFVVFIHSTAPIPCHSDTAQRCLLVIGDDDLCGVCCGLVTQHTTRNTQNAPHKTRRTPASTYDTCYNNTPDNSITTKQREEQNATRDWTRVDEGKKS